MDVTISRLKGKAIHPYINDLAKLRIAILKDYPYLYEGDLEYERNYLSTYTNSDACVMILAKDGDKVIGASTAIPLEFEVEEFKRPFIQANMNINDIFYFGESVLDKRYRGKGIYRHFFLEREAAAREYGSRTAAFCAVERALDDPRRPKDYQPLDVIWKRYGYTKHAELTTTFDWLEVGATQQSTNPMTFWLKKL